jgi:hypothetical protein
MAEQQPQLPDRIQRDLEEALRQGGVDKLPKRPRRQRRSFRLGVPDPRPRNPGQLVLIGVALFLIGWVVRVPYWPQFILIGLGCVGLAVFTYFLQPQGYQKKYWREHYIDVPSGRWQERLYRFVYHTS